MSDTENSEDDIDSSENGKKCKVIKYKKDIESDEEDNKIEIEKFDIKNLTLTQNIIEGNWPLNYQTKYLINTQQELYNEIFYLFI